MGIASEALLTHRQRATQLSAASAAQLSTLLRRTLAMKLSTQKLYFRSFFRPTLIVCD